MKQRVRCSLEKTIKATDKRADIDTKLTRLKNKLCEKELRSL